MVEKLFGKGGRFCEEDGSYVAIARALLDDFIIVYVGSEKGVTSLSRKVEGFFDMLGM